MTNDANFRNIQVDDYFALKSVGGPHVSPNGEWVAYTVRTKDLENNRSETRLWMIPTAGGEPMPMTAKGSSVWSPGWSPDGRHLTFIGGIDTQHILGLSSPREVRDHVRERIRVLGKGGGYICGPEHCIKDVVPFENATAMYDAIAEFNTAGS